MQNTAVLSTTGKCASQRIRVVLVDDNPGFIEVVARFLSTNPRIEIVGLAFSGADALELVGSVHPDIVLIDLNMPEMNGLQITKMIKDQKTTSNIIIMVNDNAVQYRYVARSMQADGIVAKSEIGTHALSLIYTLCGCIRRV